MQEQLPTKCFQPLQNLKGRSMPLTMFLPNSGWLFVDSTLGICCGSLLLGFRSVSGLS